MTERSIETRLGCVPREKRDYLLANVDIYINGLCKTNQLDIPNSVQMYTIQSNGVHYCGVSSTLKHVYSGAANPGFMTTILLEEKPTLKAIANDETPIVTSATYDGLLTTSGLSEQLKRPISHYYSPPLVDIVKNKNGNVRAVIVDATYAIANHHDYETLEILRYQIYLHQQQREYLKASQLYNDYKSECIRLAYIQWNQCTRV